MDIHLLTPTILTSRAMGNLQGRSANKISTERIKSDLERIISSNTSLLRQNEKEVNVSFSNKYPNSPFLSSALPVANTDGTYTLNGVSFSKKEFEQCRSVMQAAVSGIETTGTIDYINYAQMSIAVNAVQSYAKANLSGEQASVLCNTIQEYNTAVISNEKNLLADRGCINSDIGKVSEYYGIQGTYSDDEIKVINELIDEMNRVSGGNKAHVGKDFTATIASATNRSLIQGISELFANVDLSNSTAVNNTMGSYKAFMTPVYLANGITNQYGALSRVLNNSTEKLSNLINRIAISVNRQSLNLSI